MCFSRFRMLLLVTAVLPAVAGLVWAESPYRMEGVVTEADTQQAVANATVQVLITSASDPAERVRRARTNEEGRYSIDLPAGHAWAWYLEPPEGFCPVETNPTALFATTDESPVFTRNYTVQKGTPVHFTLRYPDGVADRPKTFVLLGQHNENEYISGYCETDEDGTGTITMREPAGRFDIQCVDAGRIPVAPEGMHVHFEEGFDPRSVGSNVTKREDGSTIVRDTNGASATLQGCEALVHDHRLSIVIPLTENQSEVASTQLRGRIVDANSNGIHDATVSVAFRSNGGSSASDIKATTDRAGDFVIGVPTFGVGQEVALIITGDGFGGRDTEPMVLDAAADGKLDVGKITLHPGCLIRVRVVGPDGSPLHGAVVEPVNDYASRTRIARTGPDGECLLTDLASGLMRVSAQFGKLYTSTTIPLNPGENEPVVLKLAPPATAPATDPPQQPPALAAGTAAPDWSIAEWTDGKQRLLSDYRGKVVVLDFWGIWCGPCIHAIPAMKELHERYREDEVVILGIHTAGTDMPIVKRFLKHHEWNLPVGLDAGDDIADGETVRSYAIQGYPSVIVIDRNGTIAFNSGDVPQDRDQFMQSMERLAKSAGVPWPIDKDATEEQVIERMTRLQVAMFSQQIDEALKTPAD